MEAAVIIALITTLGGIVVAIIENRKRKTSVIDEVRKMGVENARDHKEVQQALTAVAAGLNGLQGWAEQHDQRHLDLNERLDSINS